MTLGEFVRLRDGVLVVAEAMEVERLVCGIRAHRAPGSRTSNHAETLGKLLNILLGATVQVVDSPV